MLITRQNRPAALIDDIKDLNQHDCVHENLSVLIRKQDRPTALIDDIKDLNVQMKCFFFIPEFERAARIRKIAVYRFLISLLVPEL